DYALRQRADPAVLRCCEVWWERGTVASCGSSTCLKTPQSAVREEAEAVPAESNGPQRKTPQRIRRSLYQRRGLKAIQLKEGAIINKIITGGNNDGSKILY